MFAIRSVEDPVVLSMEVFQSVFSLVYASSARPLLADPDLVQLLQQSREKNARLGVTGMLLYKKGNFIQVLEGPEKNVRDLYLTISKDHRHKGLILLLEEKIASRWFPNWSMGFRNLRDVNLEEVPGYTDFLSESLMSPFFQSDPANAQRLLSVFRRIMSVPLNIQTAREFIELL